uniref:Reverse transcriptase zinc-binding domain-containing protein n=1 Tax=Cajanus cajan TaxID=3821 RepID=A0A151TLG3_CAJCA|nr:hypothetical protein KK1_024225 [Cajanus cajan]
MVLQWHLLHNALPLVDNLLRRGIDLPPLNSMCVMCNEQPENLLHLFFYCPIADQLWMYYFCWVSISTVLPQIVRQHYCRCFGRHATKRRGTLLGVSLYGVFGKGRITRFSEEEKLHWRN